MVFASVLHFHGVIFTLTIKAIYCIVHGLENTFPHSQMQFLITDITEQDYEQESFDVIYSRDTLLHIKGKEALFLKFFVSTNRGVQQLR